MDGEYFTMSLLKFSVTRRTVYNIHTTYSVRFISENENERKKKKNRDVYAEPERAKAEKRHHQ